jgi:DNA-binding MltR family transcriptional regulator
MKFRPNSEQAQKRMMALIEEMDGQTDRGVAIVGAAWVEEAMSVAIESFLHPEPKAWQRLFGGNGPLATLSAKIDLVRLLGLVTETIRSDLHIIRDVRNEFAHQIAHKTEHTRLSFSSPHIKDKCMALKCVAHEKLADPRVAFVRACATLNSDFQMLQFFAVKVSDGGHIFAKIEHEA